MDKISFIGDLMFEKPYVRAKKSKDGTYDFSGLLINLCSILQESDLVVANLETCFAGEGSGYTNGLYSFNTPDEALDVLKECNITLVTTANNHCLDRGVMGLRRTIDVLKSHCIDSTGTYADPNEQRRSAIRHINGTRYAFMSYTYGTNTLENKVLLAQDEIGLVNLVKPQEQDKLAREGNKQSLIVRVLSTCSQRVFSSETRMIIKRMLGMTLNVPIVDDNISLDEGYIQRMEKDIEETRSQSDVIFMCFHSGGQFNAKPGAFTTSMVGRIHKAGVKHVVATHPHVVQRYESDNEGNSVFYSLGSLNISPSSIYVLRELKPDYSIIPHFYFEKSELQKTTFSIVKVIEDKQHSLCVYPTSLLAQQLTGDEKEQLKEDVTFIYNRVMGSSVAEVEIKDEYEIK